MFRLLSVIYELIYKLFDFLWNLAYRKSAERIRATARVDAHAAVMARAGLKRKRIVIRFVYSLLVICLFGGAAAYFLVKMWDDKGLAVYILTLLIALPALEVFYTLVFRKTGNLSLLEATDVVGKVHPYALYLRAFRADQRRIIFKEEDLVQQLLQQRVYTFAVGLPEEIDSSPGALRVYINNDTWQEEVRMLLEASSYVFLRVCNTEPCLWEIRQVLASEKELYIIVDDPEDYAAVKAVCPSLPQNLTVPEGKYAIYKRLEGGDWKNLTPYEPEKPKYEKAAFDKSFVTSLLKRFPKLGEDATLEQYEASIQELYSNLPADADHASKIRVASRIMDLLEGYCAKEDTDGRVRANARRFLEMYERFHPLPQGLQSRKEDLEKNTLS